MKKMMFNDKYGLTDAILDGRKTMTKKDYQNKKQDWSDKTDQHNKRDENLANEISKRLMLLGTFADMLDNCVADIAELTKGTPYELRREVKQETTDLFRKCASSDTLHLMCLPT